MAATIIDGKAIAATIREELAVDVAAFHADSGITPHLAAVLVGDDVVGRERVVGTAASL